MRYLVVVDIEQPIAQQTRLLGALRAMSALRVTEHAWLLRSAKGYRELRDQVCDEGGIGRDAPLLVVELTGEFSWGRLRAPNETLREFLLGT